MISIADYQNQWEDIGVLTQPEYPVKLAKDFDSNIYGMRDSAGQRFWIPALYLLGADLFLKKSISDH